MRILIETKNLIDFPYQPEYETLFRFDPAKEEAMVSELMYGNPTCYLVSGYRGSGKTSFMNRVQHLCRKQQLQGKGDTKLIFVNTNFSRFDNRINFLRKIIRDLRETVLLMIQKKDKILSLDTENLFKRTFYDVKQEFAKNKEIEHSTETELNINQLIRKIITGLTPLLLPLGYDVAVKFSALMAQGWIRWIALGAGVIWTAINLVSIKKKYSFKKTVKWSSSEESITDDDIISYYLDNLLDKFRKEGYRIAFILDEMDKVDDDELDDLLKELKPWLVRGMSDFIIVAGQKLTMKYFEARAADDNVLTSLFSKVEHIPLSPTHILENLFNNYLYKGLVEDDGKINSLPVNELPNNLAETVAGIRNKYIYRSRKVPRTFMNLLRQDLNWKQKEAFLDGDGRVSSCEIKKHDILKDIFENLNLDANIEPTARDYITTYLYRVAEDIDCSTTMEADLLKKECDYPGIRKWVNNYLNEFLARAEQAGLINHGKTIEIEKLEDTIPTVTNNFGEVIIDSFRKEFISFFEELLKLYPNLIHSKTASIRNSTLKDILRQYVQKKIFLLPETTDPLLKNNITFFTQRIQDFDLFRKVYDLFKVVPINIVSLLESMYRSLTYKTIEELQDVIARKDENLSVSEKDLADIILTPNDTKKSFDILVRYRYINGPVAINNEEVIKLVDCLDDYNSIAEQGNYFIQVIFTPVHTGDPQKEELNAALILKNLRVDLQDKIHFIILPLSWQHELKDRLTRLQNEFNNYSPKPVQNKIAAKSKSQKEWKKHNTHVANVMDAEDPQKGRWGGRSMNNGRVLSAKVIAAPAQKDWYYITLRVEAEGAAPPLTGSVTFYLHDSFQPDKYKIRVQNGIAVLSGLGAYEAFTVGATCDNNTTKLELDLNMLTDAPAKFKY